MSVSMEVGMACSPSPGRETLRMESNMGFRDSSDDQSESQPVAKRQKKINNGSLDQQEKQRQAGALTSTEGSLAGDAINISPGSDDQSESQRVAKRQKKINYGSLDQQEKQRQAGALTSTEGFLAGDAINISPGSDDQSESQRVAKRQKKINYGSLDQQEKQRQAGALTSTEGSLAGDAINISPGSDDQSESQRVAKRQKKINYGSLDQQEKQRQAGALTSTEGSLAGDAINIGPGSDDQSESQPVAERQKVINYGSLDQQEKQWQAGALTSTEGSLAGEAINVSPGAVISFQRFHYVLVLKYFWLKEEITKSTAMFVADGLYAAQNGQNGFISDPHYEKIKECRRRRQIVDILLKNILRSTKETYKCFLQLLTKSEDGHIANSLDEIIPTDAQFQEFEKLQLSSLGNGPRPDCHFPRFMLQERVFQRLKFMLNDDTAIETIADYLLSRLFFSIREHTNITSCPLKDEQRIGSLLHTMMKCSNRIRQALKEVLDILKMEHVLSDLTGIRKDPCDQEMLGDNDLPKRVLDSKVERNIVDAFQAEPLDLRIKTLKEISFEVEEIGTGSIWIRLRPVDQKSWQIFQEKCSSGDIRHFIASVYDNETLEEGRYEIDVNIYQELTLAKDHCRAIIHLKDKNEIEIGVAVAKEMDDLDDLQLFNDGNTEIKAGILKPKESYIARHMDLLCEEMDVSTSLLSFLSQHELINDFVKEELKRKNGRAEKVRYLLTECSLKEHAEEMLKRFIQKTDIRLFEDIESMENETNPVKEEENMKDPQNPRYKIVYRLLTNERAYVTRLHLLDLVFHLRVTSENMKDNFMPPEVVTQIFSHIHSIYQLHHDSVLPQLETRMANWFQEERIGDIFLEIAPLLNLYREYVMNFDKAMDLIAIWTIKAPKFASLLQEIQKYTECDQLTLREHMFELKQRVDVYVLHLKEYLKCLDPESPDIENVIQALAALLMKAGEYTNHPLEKSVSSFVSLRDLVSDKTELEDSTTQHTCSGHTAQHTDSLVEDEQTVMRITAKRTARRLYFTAVAILMVKKNDSSRGKAVKRKCQFQSWCPKLYDPVCYFEKKTNTADYYWPFQLSSGFTSRRSSTASYLRRRLKPVEHSEIKSKRDPAISGPQIRATYLKHMGSEDYGDTDTPKDDKISVTEDDLATQIMKNLQSTEIFKSGSYVSREQVRQQEYSRFDTIYRPCSMPFKFPKVGQLGGPRNNDTETQAANGAANSVHTNLSSPSSQDKQAVTSQNIGFLDYDSPYQQSSRITSRRSSRASYLKRRLKPVEHSEIKSKRDPAISGHQICPTSLKHMGSEDYGDTDTPNLSWTYKGSSRIKSRRSSRTSYLRRRLKPVEHSEIKSKRDPAISGHQICPTSLKHMGSEDYGDTDTPSNYVHASDAESLNSLDN